MIITEAKMFDGWLMIKPAQAQDAMKWLYSFKENKNYEILRKTEKRSLNANSYAWVLITRLAEEIGLPKEEVYRRAIENIGGKSTVLAMRSKAVDAFTESFCDSHIGRKVEILKRDDVRTDLLVTYGSSDFDRRQMSQFIESLISDCQAVGIETKSPEEISSLLSSWKGE